MTTIDTNEITEPGWLFAHPALWADMDVWHERVAALRQTNPVLAVEIEGYDPFWVLTRHADVFAVERDDAHWLNTSRSVLGPREQFEQMVAMGLPEPASLVHLDGEHHRTHRAVTNDWFKPAVVKRRQGRIDEIADSFIAKMRDLGGECDFASDIAVPYTLHVIMDIYGIPEEEEPLMLELTQGVFGAADPEFAGDQDPQLYLIQTGMKYMQYFNDVTEDRRANPRDDLATVIANGEVGGCPMGDVERFWYYVIVATAGHDTTSYALSGGMEALLRDPAQFDALRDDPTLVPGAADEMVRWTSPVRHFMRWATEDSEVRGVKIPEGGAVLLSYASANRDEDTFVDAGRFDVRRTDADKQIGFGVGAHFCLGAQFARSEVRTMIGKLAQQLDHIEPAGDAQWSLSHFVSGVKHLPVRYSFT